MAEDADDKRSSNVSNHRKAYRYRFSPNAALLPHQLPSDRKHRSGGNFSALNRWSKRDLPELRGEVGAGFGASWLPCHRTQLQGVKSWPNQYSDRGVVVYWVSTEPDNPKAKNYASDEQLRAFAKKYGLDVTVLRESGHGCGQEAGRHRTAPVVILDKQGNIAGEVIKGLDPTATLWASWRSAEQDSLK